MAEAGAPSNIKRRRISTDDDAQQGPNSLSDLPSGILAHAANFLAPPSRALFAIALDGSSASSPNERSSAIVGNQWDVLDFGDIEKDLAAKLSDDYIERVLLCIDAVNKLKRLKLTNCVNITGAGLEPLRGSAIIEQIDLSLVGGNQSPRLSPEPPISCDDVLPILDSIIEREGCALKYIQFPHVWCKRENASAHSEFHAFIARYNEMWTSRGAISCLGCNRSLPRHGEPWIRTQLCYYGTQRHTCYDCLKHYCDNNLGSERERHMIRKCGICERDYCVDCMNTQLCPLCQGYTCIDCYDECQRCNEKEICLCRECKCEDCGKVLCEECNNVEGEEILRTCDHCCLRYCNNCRVQKLFRQGQQGCAGCIEECFSVRECMRLYEEVEQLKAEVKELKLENKELRSRNTD